MSNSATAAAKRRRAGIVTPTIVDNKTMNHLSSNSTNNNNSNVNVAQENASKGLTLHQVISLIDNRLISLEKSFVSSKNDTSRIINISPPNTDFQDLLAEHVSEFNHRYELLAGEIASLKNIVIGLQSFTMQINKSLVEERVRLLERSNALVIKGDSQKNNITFEEVVNETSSENTDAPISAPFEMRVQEVVKEVINNDNEVEIQAEM